MTDESNSNEKNLPQEANSLTQGNARHYSPEELENLVNHGSGDLMNEIYLMRVILYRAISSMNAEQGKLSFQDHLSALRAFSHATGRVADLMQKENAIFNTVAGRKHELNAVIEELDGLLETLLDRTRDKDGNLPHDIEVWWFEHQLKRYGY